MLKSQQTIYSMYTVQQLKDALRARNITTGKKADLIARLEAYDTNFSTIENEDGEEQMTTPAAECYKDVNANTSLPPVTKYHIQAFIDRFTQKSTKGLQMYENRYLLTVRACKVDNFTYIKSHCKASMKKMFYVVDIKLKNDCGGIEETHCECAAGSGQEAHCKHVLAVLYGIENMVNNKCLLIHQVCTQQLMTFKRPKPFYASPIKCEDLPLKKKIRNINYDPVNNNDVPVAYSDYVRNLVINFGKTSAPFKQTFYPANTYVIEWDHSFYLEKTGEDHVLEGLHLKNVSLSQIKLIEENTRAQSLSALWNELRKTHITASNFHTICHCSVENRKKIADRIISPKIIKTKATMHGQIHELYAIMKFEEMYEVKIERCGLFISKTHSFMGASPDGLFRNDTIVEVKCPYNARNREINTLNCSLFNYVVKW